MSGNTKEAYDKYLIRFTYEFIKPLPKITFKKVEEYEMLYASMFMGWDILTRMHPYASPVKTKKFKPLMDMIYRFDTALGRPLKVNVVRCIVHQPEWKLIQNEARRIS